VAENGVCNYNADCSAGLVCIDGRCLKPAAGGAIVATALPVEGDGTAASPLSMAAASSSADGYLSKADWTRFDAKVSSVSAGDGISIGGTASAPLVGVVFGSTAGTCAAGD